MEDITLVLNHRQRNLWLMQDDTYIGCIWGVTRLEKAGESPVERVRILRDGKQIGNLWEIKKIKETW